MLILTRKPGQAFAIRPDPALDPATPVGSLFVAGAIRIEVTGVQGQQVKLGVAAHPQLHILREELLACEASGPVPEMVREVLARKLKVMMLVRRLGSAQLAEAAGLSLTTVRAAECGVGGVVPR